MYQYYLIRTRYLLSLEGQIKSEVWEAVLAGACEAETRRKAQRPGAIYLVASHCRTPNRHPANAQNPAFLVLAEMAKALFCRGPYFVEALGNAVFASLEV